MRYYTFFGTYDYHTDDEKVTLPHAGAIGIDRESVPAGKKNEKKMTGYAIDANYEHNYGRGAGSSPIGMNPLYSLDGVFSSLRDSFYLRFEKLAASPDAEKIRYNFTKVQKKEPETALRATCNGGICPAFPPKAPEKKYLDWRDNVIGEFKGMWLAGSHKGDATITLSRPEVVLVNEVKIGSLGWTARYYPFGDRRMHDESMYK